MVTTRRTPGVPSNRANSTQSAPKIPKARPAVTESALRTAVIEDALADSPRKKLKGKAGKAGKAKRAVKKRKSVLGGLVELISRLALLWFTVYTLSVCPEDDKLQSPVCRGLYHYRRLVLEPYVFPVIQQALNHPTVAPYVEAVKPQINRAIEFGTPIVINARDNFKTHVVPQWDKRVVPTWNEQVVPQWNKHVVPQWNQHVVPQWNQHVVPQWNQHVIPVYNANLAPYITQAQKALGPYYAQAVVEYHQRIVPNAKVAAITLHQWQQASQPYVILAAQKAHEGYVAAKPYAAPLWERIKEILGEVIALLAVQRRKFVDPHVAQIWDRVTELSTGTKANRAAGAVKSTASIVTSKAKASVSSVSSVASSASSVVSKSASSVVSVASSSLSSVSSAASSSVSSVSKVATAKVSTVSTKVQVATESALAPASEVLPAVPESTNVNTYTTSSSVAERVAATASSVTSEVSSSASSVGDKVADVTSSIVSAASSVAGQASSVASSVTSKATSAASSVSKVATQSTQSVASSASSIASVASESTQSGKAAVGTAAAEAVDPVLAAAAAVSAKAAALAHSASASVASAIPTEASSSDDDAGMDDFLGDLGFSADLTPLEDEAEEENIRVSPAAPEEPTPETEEEKEARLAKVAEKRRKVTGRHSEWELKLDAEIKEQTKALREELLDMRKTVATQLKAKPEIHADFEDLAAEAEKYIKGAEGFLKSLNKEKKSNEEKSALWSKIVDRVEDKFTKRLPQTEALVNSYYDAISLQELDLVKQKSDQVQALADAAQEDIGLDYIWLDDVTYHDWQRYHDLVRACEKFLDRGIALHNGSHPNPIANPVQEVIEELENEVQNIVVGFETRLRKLNRDGARSFKGDTGDAAPVADDTVDDAPIPKVTIPVVPSEEREPGAQDVPPVVIGRGKAEVEQALGAVEAQEQTETMPPVTPDSAKSAEELVGEVVEEVKNGGNDAPLKVEHVEL